MNARLRTGLVLLCIVLLGSIDAYAGGIKLRYGFQTQTQYKWRTAVEVVTLPDPTAPAGMAGVSVGLGLDVTLVVNKVLTADQLACSLVLDTLSLQVTRGDGVKTPMPLGSVRGKFVNLNLSTRGIASNIAPSDTLNLETARQAVGFDLFSRELLNRMLIFMEFPENNVATGESWSYTRVDTITREGQRLRTQRMVQCKLLEDTTMENHPCRRIAFSTFARIEGAVGPIGSSVGMKGTTTSEGVFYMSLEGIPLRTTAGLDSEVQLGGMKPVKQKGKLETQAK